MFTYLLPRDVHPGICVCVGKDMNSLCCVCACGKNLGVRANALSLSLRLLFDWLNVFNAELSPKKVLAGTEIPGYGGKGTIG